MKKTWIIVAVIAVVAVVAFLLFRKKDDSSDGKTIGLGNPNANGEENKKFTVEDALREQIIVPENRSLGDLVGKDASLTQQVSYLQGMTEGEISNYKKMVEAYKKSTGEDLTGLSYDVVRQYSEDLKEMERLQYLLSQEFNETVDLSVLETNELKEVQEKYNLTSQKYKTLANSLGARFIAQFNLENAFDIEKKNRGTKLVGIKPFDSNTMNSLIELPPEAKKYANDYVKTHWDGSYNMGPKNEKLGSANSFVSDCIKVNLNGKGITEAIGALRTWYKNKRGAAIAGQVALAYTGI